MVPWRTEPFVIVISLQQSIIDCTFAVTKKRTVIMNREYLQVQGFEGFITMGEMMDGARTLIPVQKGIYVELYESESVSHFLSEGTG